MDKKDYNVSVNDKKNSVVIEVKVASKPKYYDTTAVLKELKKLGHKVSESGWIRRSKPVRSDDGERSSTGTWEYNLPQKDKPKKQAVKKTPPVKKTPLVKKTSRKATKSVVE